MPHNALAMNIRFEPDSKKKLDAFLAWAQGGLELLPDDVPEEVLGAFVSFIQGVSFCLLRLNYQDFMTGKWRMFRGSFQPIAGEDNETIIVDT